MIITVITVRMVQMAVDKVIDMVAVRHCFVTAIGSVNVVGVVPITLVTGRASRWIG